MCFLLVYLIFRGPPPTGGQVEEIIISMPGGFQRNRKKK